MSDILRDLSVTALANACKDNMLAYFAHFERAPVANFQRGPNTVRWQLPFQFPWFNGVASTAAPGADESALIRETQAYYRAAGYGTMTWWLPTMLAGGDWDRQLRAHGFGYDESTPGMAIRLADLPESSLPPGLEIRPVEDAAALRDWCDTFVPGYGLPPGWHPALLRLMSELGLDLPIRHYLGRLNGETVSVSTLILGAGVAGIQNVATLPGARGRGIGGALTLAPLRDARALGYQAGVLQSSAMGFNVYRGLGFEKVCDIGNYYWTPDSGA